jgi:hypothetical protein
VSEPVRCGNTECGIVLDEPPNVPQNERVPCPECGSLARIYSKQQTAEAKAVGSGSVRVFMQPHLWVWWAEIAIDQERLAREARAKALRITPAGGETFIEALACETRASLIAVAASAHALDALYGVMRDIITPVETGTRWSTLLETFKAAFNVRGHEGGGGWAREFEWLFDLRDSAVHHDEESRESVPHPTGTNVSWANVAYSLESAERAVNLMVDVLDTAVGAPRPPIADWARDHQHALEALHERRR